MVPGRLERVPSEVGSIFVDYAHTPGALKNVLDALHAVRKGRIITVMGCGGDRDKTKRPLMGWEAAVGSGFRGCDFRIIRAAKIPCPSSDRLKSE